ncbi:SDR family NAD(P)-dependent oxidoreductase [Robbsia andropogonis]|uniref:SDR family NAD(P)-dependent oxidoreductase n=1 Tax=Robbsia andropogonis TaxID=28092 RepID=UPI003D1A9B58
MTINASNNMPPDFGASSLARAYAAYPTLRDRCVFISGGATGIGAALVEAFAAQGARVGFVDLDEKAGTALVEKLAPLPSTVHRPCFVAADITEENALNDAIAQIRAACGPITVLVNNAANDKRHRVEETTYAFWDKGIAVNLRHQFFAAQQVMEDMKQAGGGSIINFGSISWKLKQGGMPAYTASKAAVQGLTRCLARDLGPYNIRVNTVMPGWVMTEKQLALWVDDAAKEDIAKGQCINAPLLPIHIASMALFLAADDSAMCTAQDFVVDGGWT